MEDFKKTLNGSTKLTGRFEIQDVDVEDSEIVWIGKGSDGYAYKVCLFATANPMISLFDDELRFQGYYTSRTGFLQVGTPEFDAAEGEE